MRRPARRLLQTQQPRRERRLRTDPREQLRKLPRRAFVVAERLERRGELRAGPGVIGIESQRLALREGGETDLARLEEREPPVVPRFGVARRKLRRPAIPARGGFRPARLVQDARALRRDPRAL